MFYLVEILGFQAQKTASQVTNPERTAPKRQREETGYIEIFQQRAGSLNIKRLLLI